MPSEWEDRGLRSSVKGGGVQHFRHDRHRRQAYGTGMEDCCDDVDHAVRNHLVETQMPRATRNNLWKNSSSPLPSTA